MRDIIWAKLQKDVLPMIRLLQIKCGETGLASRIINPLLGSQIAFCMERYDAGSAMEQPPLRTVRAVVDNARKIMEGR